MQLIPTVRSTLSRKDFDNKFKPAFRELDYLRLKAFQKTGFWIFQSHAFSIDELLESPHFSKINSVVEKIGDDVNNWKKQDQLSFFDRNFYSDNRKRLDDKVHQLKTEIIERQPTWWEKFHPVFDNFFDRVMDKLPDIGIPFLPVQVTNMLWKMLPSGKSDKRLPPD